MNTQYAMRSQAIIRKVEMVIAGETVSRWGSGAFLTLSIEYVRHSAIGTFFQYIRLFVRSPTRCEWGMNASDSSITMVTQAPIFDHLSIIGAVYW